MTDRYVCEVSGTVVCGLADGRLQVCMLFVVLGTRM